MRSLGLGLGLGRGCLTIIGGGGSEEPEPAGENLLASPDDMLNSTYWYVSGTFESAAVTDPFGGTNAYLLERAGTTSVDGFVRQTDAEISGDSTEGFAAQATPGADIVASIYAKYGTEPYLWLRARRTTDDLCGGWFDLQNGQVGSTEGAATLAMTDAGDGWYRCEVRFTSSGAESEPSQMFIALPADADGSTSRRNGQHIYLIAPKYEEGTEATPYQQS